MTEQPCDQKTTRLVRARLPYTCYPRTCAHKRDPDQLLDHAQPYSLLRLALLLWEDDDGPDALISGRLSSGLPSRLPEPSDMSPSKITSPGPSAPTPPFALVEMLRLDLPGFPRRVRPAGALTKSVKLESEGVKTRVVSLPCWSIFDQQPQEYRLSVLRSGAPILAVEALSVSARLGFQQRSRVLWDHGLVD